jgi:hypothetical protein
MELMKRWMVRLAALSTVVLAGLVLFAHAYKGNDKQVDIGASENSNDEAESVVKPIPLTAELDASPPGSDPFANRSTVVEQTEPSESDRYAQTSYREQPADEPETANKEPQRLEAPDDAAAIPAPRNPFQKKSADRRKGSYVERAATVEPADDKVDEPLTAVEAGPSEALTPKTTSYPKTGKP